MSKKDPDECGVQCGRLGCRHSDPGMPWGCETGPNCPQFFPLPDGVMRLLETTQVIVTALTEHLQSGEVECFCPDAQSSQRLADAIRKEICAKCEKPESEIAGKYYGILCQGCNIGKALSESGYMTPRQLKQLEESEQ